MPASRIEALKNKAKLLQKAKKRAGKTIQLKTALAIIAKTSGYESWRDLKKTAEANELFSFPYRSAFWNIWYASYEKARAHLEEHGGFLLPYQKHFFICDIHYIENLGLHPSDPDLEKVGKDWTQPLDGIAWKRLLKKIAKHGSNPKEGVSPLRMVKGNRDDV